MHLLLCNECLWLLVFTSVCAYIYSTGATYWQNYKMLIGYHYTILDVLIVCLSVLKTLYYACNRNHLKCKCRNVTCRKALVLHLEGALVFHV